MTQVRSFNRMGILQDLAQKYQILPKIPPDDVLVAEWHVFDRIRCLDNLNEILTHGKDFFWIKEEDALWRLGVNGDLFIWGLLSLRGNEDQFGTFVFEASRRFNGESQHKTVKLWTTDQTLVFIDSEARKTA